MGAFTNTTRSEIFLYLNFTNVKIWTIIHTKNYKILTYVRDSREGEWWVKMNGLKIDKRDWTNRTKI